MTRDQTDTLSRFRERLNEVVRGSGMSQSAFAREAQIDRSTLSQLLSDQNHRLPRVETMIGLWRTTGVSLDWLLGLSNDGPNRTDIVQEELSVSARQLSPLDETLIGWYQDAVGQKVRYIPASVPDFLKTERVIRHEMSGQAITRPEQRIERADARLMLARSPGSDVECCSPIQIIEGLARGQGVFTSLPLADRIAQLDRMIELTEELYPTLRWFLYDGRQRYAGSMTVFGLDRVVLYLGKLHIVFTGEGHILAFVEQFDDLIKVAVVQPPAVPKMLRKLRSEIVRH